MKVHAAIARALSEHGVDVLFGLAGDANLFMIDHFMRAHRGRYISSAHEAGAVLMAHGYAHTSGKLGVATVTHGPALTNTITALIEGVRSHTPLVLIAGDTPLEDKENLQSCDQPSVILGTGAGFEQVRSARTVVEDLATAIRRAQLEQRPIVLNTPVAIQWDEVEYRSVAVPLVAPQAVGPDLEALDSAAGIIASARRPIVLAGRGATTGPARDALLRLAERIGAPVATTLKGKDLFRGEPFDLGIFGTLASPVASEAILASDCVVAFGASLNKWTTASGSLLEGKRLVQCDLERAQLAAFAAPDAAVVGDAAAVADAIVGLLDAAEVPASGFRSQDLARRLAAYSPATFADRGTDQTIDLRSLLLRIEAVVPRDRTLITDGGQFIFDALRLLHVPHPRAFVLGVNFGSIGLGMGNAIGAACGAPGRTALLVTGDGGFMLGGLAEFNTAVRHKVDLIVVLCNNGSYGPEYVHLRNRHMDPALSLFEWPDFARVADALGGRGITIRNVNDLDLLTEAIATRDRPLLIDAKLDPELTETERERTT